jgi:hypothetical protein
MVIRGKEESLSLIEYVRMLENRDSLARGNQVQAVLDAMNVETTIQKCHRPQIKNIIADFSPDSEKKLLFSAHYDVVKGTPGANDNASGVAVLLGLCQKLKDTRAPVRVVFFDREEAWLRTPILRLGLLGSLYYVLRTNTHNISAVYNLEFCGLGDCLGIWPIKNNETNLPAYECVTRAAMRLKLPFKSVHIPWPLLSSDHLSFRLRGISNAMTLSLIPVSQISAMEKSLAELNPWGFIGHRRPELPESLSSIHTANDISSRLSEDSLRRMLSLLLEIVGNYRCSGDTA